MDTSGGPFTTGRPTLDALLPAHRFIDPTIGHSGIALPSDDTGHSLKAVATDHPPRRSPWATSKSVRHTPQDSSRTSSASPLRRGADSRTDTSGRVHMAPGRCIRQANMNSSSRAQRATFDGTLGTSIQTRLRVVLDHGEVLELAASVVGGGDERIVRSPSRRTSHLASVTLGRRDGPG